MSHLEWPRRVAALAQFTVEDVNIPVLATSDDHHLRRVLRAKSGEEVVLTNAAGSWAFAQLADHGLSRVSDVHLDDAPTPTTLYLSPLKGDRSEWAVAKATEVGISRIVPLVSEHVVVKFKGETREKILSRWRRIAQESCAQARRTYALEVDEPVRVADVPDDVAVADFGGDPDWRDVYAVAIGPEGGWGATEWAASRRRLSLGPTVLREETAGVVAASILAFGAGSWGFGLGATSNE